MLLEIGIIDEDAIDLVLLGSQFTEEEFYKIIFYIIKLRDEHFNNDREAAYCCCDNHPYFMGWHGPARLIYILSHSTKLTKAVITLTGCNGEGFSEERSFSSHYNWGDDQNRATLDDLWPKIFKNLEWNKNRVIRDILEMHKWRFDYIRQGRAWDENWDNGGRDKLNDFYLYFWWRHTLRSLYLDIEYIERRYGDSYYQEAWDFYEEKLYEINIKLDSDPYASFDEWAYMFTGNKADWVDKKIPLRSLKKRNNYEWKNWWYG